MTDFAHKYNIKIKKNCRVSLVVGTNAVIYVAAVVDICWMITEEFSL